MKELLAVFIGGGLGSVSRYGLSVLFRFLGQTHWPIATFAANMLATIILGIMVFGYKPQAPSSLVFLLITTGFCGGFSTFSTFSLETLFLIKNGQTSWALANVLVSVIMSLFILYFLSKTLK